MIGSFEYVGGVFVVVKPKPTGEKQKCFTQGWCFLCPKAIWIYWLIDNPFLLAFGALHPTVVGVLE